MIFKNFLKMKKYLLIPFFTFLLFSTNVTYSIDENNFNKIRELNNNGVFEFVTANKISYYVYNDDVHGEELWKTDGTDTGTSLVKDIAVGETGSNINKIYVMNNKLYFFADDRVHGCELWISDGTEDGTFLLKNIFPDTDGSIYSSNYNTSFVDINNVLYFVANDGEHGIELWRTNGTSIGTYLVKDIVPGVDDSTIYYLSKMNNTLYFFPYINGSNKHLWKSDGTESGTIAIMDLPYAPSSDENSVIAYKDNLYFVLDKPGDTDLWKTDGTEDGTIPISELDESYGTRSYNNFTIYKDILLFTAYSDEFESGDQLYLTNGENVGLLDYGIFGEFWGVSSIHATSDKLFFVAYSEEYGNELWSTDGTQENTSCVKDITAGDGDSELGFLTSIDNQLFFTRLNMDGNEYQGELWQSDGTEDGTFKVANHLAFGEGLYPFYNSKESIYYHLSTEMLDFGDVKFWADGLEFWKYDPKLTKTYSVTFKDYNGNTLKNEMVDEGEDATSPSNPSREGYKFVGWDKSFKNITSDLVISALYTKNAVASSPTETDKEEPILIINNITSNITTSNWNVILDTLNKINEKFKLIDIYDVNLLLNNEKMQPEESIEIKILLTKEQKEYENLKVAYIDDDNNITIIPHTIEGDYIIFYVNHLSHFGIIGEKTDNVVEEENEEDKEEVKNDFNWLFVIIPSSLILIILAVVLRKKQDN